MMKLTFSYCCVIIIISYRASLKTRLIKEKTDRCGSCKESFRRRAFALQGRLTQQMSCIAVFSQKGVFRDALKAVSYCSTNRAWIICRNFHPTAAGFFIESKYREKKYITPPKTVAADADAISPANLPHISAPRNADTPHKSPAYATPKNSFGERLIPVALK